MLKIGPNFSMSVPINLHKAPENFDPVEMTIEVWFKSSNMLSNFLEIILGLSPYKFRKKAGMAQIQLNWGDINYCDSSSLKSDQWYHFAFTMAEDTQTLICYLDGSPVPIGISPMTAITSNIERLKEIAFGTSVDKKISETPFVGYVKEFRWWQKVRSQFQINNFKNVML